jgi:hypothetical protein
MAVIEKRVASRLENQTAPSSSIAPAQIPLENLADVIGTVPAESKGLFGNHNLV